MSTADQKSVGTWRPTRNKKRKIAKLQWTEVQSIHLTLLFVGQHRHCIELLQVKQSILFYIFVCLSFIYVLYKKIVYIIIVDVKFVLFIVSEGVNKCNGSLGWIKCNILHGSVLHKPCEKCWKINVNHSLWVLDHISHC